MGRTFQKLSHLVGIPNVLLERGDKPEKGVWYRHGRLPLFLLLYISITFTLCVGKVRFLLLDPWLWSKVSYEFRVCPSLQPPLLSFYPSNQKCSQDWLISFSWLSMVIGSMCCCVWQCQIFWKKYFCPKNGENGPKRGKK